MPPTAPPSLKTRALRLLSRREYSRLELERKLAAHAQENPEELTRALDALESCGLINETRVAESVVHRRASLLGTARVRQELKAKGLSDDLVAHTVEELRRTEFERAHAAWRKKFGTPATNAAARARQMRFLATRGFAPDIIRRVVAGHGAEE